MCTEKNPPNSLQLMLSFSKHGSCIVNPSYMLPGAFARLYRFTRRPTHGSIALLYQWASEGDPAELGIDRFEHVTRAMAICAAVTTSGTRQGRRPKQPEEASPLGRSKCPTTAWRTPPAHPPRACYELKTDPAREAAPGTGLWTTPTCSDDTNPPSVAETSRP